MSRAIVVLSFAALTALNACSSDRSGRVDPQVGGTGGSGSMSGAGGNAGSSGFGNPDPDAGGIFMPPPMDDAGIRDASMGDGALNEGNACGMGTAQAELTQVNMLVMFDRSGSMLDDDKWDNATAALTTFFEDEGTDGLKVALRFFPHDEPQEGCTEDGCNAEACAEPLVAIGELTADPAPADAHEAAVVSAIESSPPKKAAAHRSTRRSTERCAGRRPTKRCSRRRARS
jgi:hypothetical protein